MSDKETSPQNVVVPVDAEKVLDAAAAYLRQQYGASHGLDHPIDRKRILSSIPPAPAPSSLAGGEVTSATMDRLRQLVDAYAPGNFALSDGIYHVYRDVYGSTHTLYADLKSILAALSPEAPARQGDVSAEEHRARGVRLIGMTEWAGAHLCRAEKAEAKLASLSGGADVEAQIAEAWDSLLNADDRTSPDEYPEHLLITRGELAGFMGDAAFIARVSEPAALTPRHEAPAEGAGEAMDAGFEAWLNERNLLPHGAWDWPSIVAMLNHHEDALRARSSAPEAREGALGNLLAVIHGDGGHRALEVGTKQAALEAEKIVAGLLAAPSADKLRIAVEASGFLLDRMSDLEQDVNERDFYGHVRPAASRLRQALAALKSEDAK